jgi:HEAT repeat protein
MSDELKELKKLAAKMRNRKDDVRYNTACKLSKIVNSQVTDILIESLEKEENSNTINILSEALTKFRELKVIACLCKKLESEEFPFWDLQPVINALCEMQDKQALPALIDYFRDKRKPLVNKSIIVDKLAGLVDKTTLYLLARFLQNNSTQDFFTFQQLKKINFNSATNLIALLSDPSAHIREEAVHLLGNHLSESVKVALMKVLINDSSEEVKNSAKSVLRYCSASPLLPDFISILRENNKSVYHKLHSRKSGLFGGENIFALIEQLNEKDKTLQKEAEAILSQITSSEILSILFSIFKSSKSKVQEMILETLGDDCSFESLLFLKKSLQDKKLKIRTNAAIYLASQESFVKTLDVKEKKLLVKVLSFALTKNFYTENVISVLSKIDCLLVGELNFLEIQPFIPGLLGALKKGNEYTRQNAIKILEKIETQHGHSNEEFIFCLVKMAKSSYSLNYLASETLLAISPIRKILASEILINDLLETLTNPDVNKVTYQVLEKTIHSDIVPTLLRKARYENDGKAIKSLKELALHENKKNVDAQEDINWLESLAKKYNEIHKKVTVELKKYKKGLKKQTQKQQEPDERDLYEVLKDLRTEDQKTSKQSVEYLEKLKKPKDLVKLIDILNSNKEFLSPTVMKFLQRFKSVKVKLLLIDALEHSEKRVRLEAAMSLLDYLKTGFLQVMPKLLEILIAEGELYNRKASLEEIASREKASTLIEILKHSNVNMRKWAIESLAARRSKKAVSSLMINLKDSDFGVRACAALALGKIANIKAISNLIEALGDDDPNVREWSSYALNEITKYRKIKNLNPNLIWLLGSALIEVLEKGDEKASFYAVMVLGRISNDEVINALINALASPIAYLRAKSAEALGQIASNKAIPHLIKVLEDDFDYVCVSSIEALGKIKNKEVLPVLIEKLNCKNPIIKAAIIKGLGQIKSLDTFHFLIEASENNDENIRQAAAFSLGELGEAKFIPILVKMTKDTEIKVQKEAIKALGKIPVLDAKRVLNEIENDIEVNAHLRQIAKSIA